MEKGFYAGSFDPFTNGHLDVVIQSARLFQEVIVAIGVNPEKKRRFDKELMKDAIEKVLISKSLTNVSVICYDNLSVDAAVEHHATFLIRGIRNGMDYEYEENIASFNREVSGLNTLYFRAGDLGNISSSMVMELFKHGKDVSKYLPKEVMEAITQS